VHWTPSTMANRTCYGSASFDHTGEETPEMRAGPLSREKLNSAKLIRMAKLRNIDEDRALIPYGGIIPRNPLSPPVTRSPVQKAWNGAFSMDAPKEKAPLGDAGRVG